MLSASEDFDEMTTKASPQTLLAYLAGAVILTISFISISGWLAESRALTSFFLGATSMKLNTALAFIGLVAGLAAIKFKHTGTQKLAAIVIIALALASVLESLLKIDLSLDQLLAADHWQGINPGRMSLLSSSCFVLAGILVYTHQNGPKHHIWFYDLLLTAYLTIPLFVLFAHIFAHGELAHAAPLEAMAFHVSINFILFALALMLLTHSKGAAGLLTRKTRHARNFRMLFFLVLVLPLILGCILRLAIDQQWIGAGIGIAIFCLFTTLLTVSSLAHHTIALDHWVKQLVGQRRISYLLQQQIHELIEISEDGIILFNGEHQILHANTGAERILGYSNHALRQMNIEELIPAHQGSLAYLKFDHYIDNPQSPQSLSLSNQIRMRHKSGRDIPVSISLTKKKHLDQILLVAIIKNMSQLDDRLKSLEKQAFVDPLTQALNRAALDNFSKRLHPPEARKSDNHFCVILLDIDDFKRINDHYGHAAGDLVLTEFAKTVQGVLRDGDRLFRTGGEEFVVVTLNVVHVDALVFGHRILNRVRAMQLKYQQTLIKITCSVGICITHNLGCELDAAIRCADAAMYKAKRGGKNRVVIATAEQSAEQFGAEVTH